VSNKKFLVVEDSMLMRAYLGDILKRHFHAEIIELKSGSELYNYLENSILDDISLILLDINLPDINGMEIAQKLQMSDKYRTIPIIVISGNVNRDTVLLSLKVGVKDVLVKPINEDDFVNRVTNVIMSGKQGKAICYEEKKAIRDFLDVVRIEMKKADRARYPLTILLMGLVRENTPHSPFTGLDCQRNLEAGLMFQNDIRKQLRETDTILGLSPLEYLVFLPFTDENGAGTVIKKLQKAACKAACDADNSQLSLIVSSVTYIKQHESTEALINSLERKYKSLQAVKTLNLLSEIQT